MNEQEMNMFESGQMAWQDLSPAARQWYTANYPADQIVVGMNDGGPVTLAMMNTGGTYTPIEASSFAGDNINPALSGSLGNLAQYYQDPTQWSQWYGTRLVDGELQQVNEDGQTLGQFLQAGGEAANFQPLSPIAGFTDDQTEGRQDLRDAAARQDQLAIQQAQNVLAGARGDLGWTPTQYGAGDQLTAVTRDDANYLNDYLNPAVQAAQQAAIGNVNSAFGSAGTLGSARNAAAAAQAATTAALPTLTQAANQQFSAQQAIDAANAQAQQLANQYNTNLSNQIAQQNTGLANQAAQYNLGQRQAWTQFSPQAQQAQLAGGNTLQAVGQQGQDLNQQLVNQDVAAWNFQQTQPEQQLFNLASLGQLAQAAQDQNIAAEPKGAAGGNPFGIISDFANIFGGGGSRVGTGGASGLGAIGGLLGLGG